MRERPNGDAFQAALSDLLVRKLISVGTSPKVRITSAGMAFVTSEGAPKPALELLLRAGRAPIDERIVACLSAAGHVPLAVSELQARTGLGPRVTKAARRHLKSDTWIIERRGSFATSPALAQLLSR